MFLHGQQGKLSLDTHIIYIQHLEYITYENAA